MAGGDSPISGPSLVGQIREQRPGVRVASTIGEAVEIPLCGKHFSFGPLGEQTTFFAEIGQDRGFRSPSLSFMALRTGFSKHHSQAPSLPQG